MFVKSSLGPQTQSGSGPGLLILFLWTSVFRGTDEQDHQRRSPIIHEGGLYGSPLPSPSCLLLAFPRLHSKSAALHNAALPLQLVSSLLFPRALAVDAQAHVPLLLQGQQLLEQFLHVGVRLGRRLHEGTLPGGGLSLALLCLHLALSHLVTLVAHQHDGNGLHGAFDGHNLQGHGIRSVRTEEASDLENFRTENPVQNEMSVQVDVLSSTFLTIENGVPQGSMLGPL